MFRGRLDRKAFAKGYIAVYVPLLIYWAIAYAYVLITHESLVALAMNHGQVVYWLVTGSFFVVIAYALLFYLPVIVGLSARRWHDIGQSGGWGILQLFSTLNLIVAIVQMFLPGDKEANQYGEPYAPRKLMDIFFGPKDTPLAQQQGGSKNLPPSGTPGPQS